jgi:4-cresol dehydrogenase (hydroxylating)
MHSEAGSDHCGSRTADSARRDGLAPALIDELADIVGPEHVLLDDASLALHSRTTEPDARQCACVAFPCDAAQVQSIMRAAQRHRTPVWPFSRGNNWGYGTRNALHAGAVIVVLERMNRIVALDPKLAYVVVEPGVTQLQLHEFLQARAPHLMADCTDSTPHGSVLGNALERGYGYTPYGDHFAQLCGLEVVLPDGRLLRTGGVLEDCPTQHTHKWGSGPCLDGLFSQGNLGIAVKGGIWLHPRPERIDLFTLDVEDDDPAAAVEALRCLALAGTLQGHVHMANGYQTLSLVCRYPDALRRAGLPIPDAQLQTLRREYGIAAWSAMGGVYGTAGEVRARRREIARALRGAGRLTFFGEREVSGAQWLARTWEAAQRRGLRGGLAAAARRVLTDKHFALVALLPELYGVLQGRPTWAVLRSAYFKSAVDAPMEDLDPARDGCGLIWLAPAIPMTGRDVQQALALVRPLFEAHGFNLSACLTMMNARTLFMLLGIFFDPGHAGERVRAETLYRALHARLAAHGYQHYRAGIPAWRCNSGARDAGAHLLDAIKRELDPGNVLAPGRYGIGTR